ncbi:PREDICTED: LOW QUALITY PROTEIN: cell death regulator Aven [Apaloderma vittatum]|uniref:LOW QUALITY PROTEIN: cell death regulator Aven n=1 Tax=Apaloderma vittatum TaxID=57397 RepID=UPI0005217F9F|nr:PREDICTED: LOW QUALITY PROTEIN: cell death regulator Aven [Apaloderma vittatum]
MAFKDPFLPNAFYDSMNRFKNSSILNCETMLVATDWFSATAVVLFGEEILVTLFILGFETKCMRHVGCVEEEDDTESREEEEKEELKSYSRRKIFSNGSRYEDTEKEGQSERGESQRGTDFKRLLSLAGDSFSQFRFADEKEWERESICNKQLSALSIDCQSLVQALQELPLHVRLNVAAELVQASTPAELPQMKSKIIEDSKRRELLKKQSEAVPVSHPVGESLAPSDPGSKTGARANAVEPFQRAQPRSKQESDHLDEELDLLLSLDAPVGTESRPASGALSYSASTEKHPKTDCQEDDSLKQDMPEEKNTASHQQQSTSKNVTEEELEDWLDSMIS